MYFYTKIKKERLNRSSKASYQYIYCLFFLSINIFTYFNLILTNSLNLAHNINIFFNIIIFTVLFIIIMNRHIF
ncbi:hypothetical protein [uncultured Catenibacterium sp.]|uniref:hypothetical protein n=1 Tax=uncultured Catenibacterium sp. TaxID=286142 RepID=UPI00338F8997